MAELTDDEKKRLLAWKGYINYKKRRPLIKVAMRMGARIISRAEVERILQQRILQGGADGIS